MNNEFFSSIENNYNGWNLDELKRVNDYLEYDPLLEKRDKWDHYEFFGVNVPRVTEILRDTIGKGYLTKWAAGLGPDYEEENAKILDTGTLVHAMIEDFINTGHYKDIYEGCDKADIVKAMKAYDNFLKFWEAIKSNGYIINPIFTEKEVVTPWFGGTIDFCAQITNTNTMESKVFILDFKTSNNISYEYYIQTRLYAEAYMFLKYNDLLGFGYLPDIDGIGVIRVDKNKDYYEYILADIYHDKAFLDDVYAAGCTMLEWYYKMHGLYYKCKAFRKSYMAGGGINGLYK